jgi:hypothetical protein
METGFQRKQKFLTEHPKWTDQDYLSVEWAYFEYAQIITLYVGEIVAMSKYGCSTSTLTNLRGLITALDTFVSNEERRRAGS